MNVSLQCCGGVLATVGVVPPLLWLRLEGRGEGGWGRELCFAIMAIFFRRVWSRERIIETTFGYLAKHKQGLTTEQTFHDILSIVNIDAIHRLLINIGLITLLET